MSLLLEITNSTEAVAKKRSRTVLLPLLGRKSSTQFDYDPRDLLKPATNRVVSLPDVRGRGYTVDRSGEHSGVKSEPGIGVVALKQRKSIADQQLEFPKLIPYYVDTKGDVFPRRQEVNDTDTSKREDTQGASSTSSLLEINPAQSSESLKRLLTFRPSLATVTETEDSMARKCDENLVSEVPACSFLRDPDVALKLQRQRETWDGRKGSYYSATGKKSFQASEITRRKSVPQ